MVFHRTAHRPSWIRVDRFLGAHGIQEDSPDGRLQFEHRMEARRGGGCRMEAIESNWGLGSDEFKVAILAQFEEVLVENHAGDLKHLSAEELRRIGWSAPDLALRRKGNPAKLAIASRLRTEAILPMTWIAQRLHLGTAKSVRPRRRTWRSNNHPTLNHRKPA